jgi:hypothetical protein
MFSMLFLVYLKEKEKRQDFYHSYKQFLAVLSFKYVIDKECPVAIFVANKSTSNSN